MRKTISIVLGLAAWATTGCGDDGKSGDDGGDAGEPACVSDLQYFEEQISVVLTQADCIDCHNPQGAARQSRMLLLASSETNYLQINFETVQTVGASEVDGVSLLLLKPIGELEHGGGVRFDRGGDKYEAMAGLVERFAEPVVCDDGGNRGDLMSRVGLLDLPGTLRKVKVQLIGELPTAEELDEVATEGEAGLNALVLRYLDEDAFYDTLIRWWNDRLLTDKYLHGDSATNLLSAETYPNRRYYNDIPDDTEEGRLARQHANASVAREPLELIAYVVRNDRPFTEVLTADYMIVNPFSAKVYGLDVDFDDELDPTEFKEAHISGVPHAGILTSPMFLNRFPTAANNRNRHRSRTVLDIFLATDINRQFDRPLDSSDVGGHNPTLNNPDCAACHAPLDPLAGAFMNWTAQGVYEVPEGGWHDDMRAPGFGEIDVPPGDWPNALQWAAAEIVEDERFALAATYAVYAGMIGRAPMPEPADESDSRYESERAFYEIEQAFLREAMEAFIDSDYRLESLIPVITRSSFYRATTAEGLDDADRETLAPLGTARWLTPEELHQKLVATTGFPWKRRVGDRNLLLNTREYLYFYGGIDSDTVTERITAPNGIMANLSLRMAYEMSCLVSPRDMKLPIEERALFPHVEMTYQPEDDNGFEIPQSVEAIRENIRYLHHRLLGETLEPGDAEEDATFELFLATWRDGNAAIEDETISTDIAGHCRLERDFWTDEALEDEDRLYRDADYTLRAWMAVVSYLLADWRFIYHP